HVQSREVSVGRHAKYGAYETGAVIRIAGALHVTLCHTEEAPVGGLKNRAWRLALVRATSKAVQHHEHAINRHPKHRTVVRTSSPRGSAIKVAINPLNQRGRRAVPVVAREGVEDGQSASRRHAKDRSIVARSAAPGCTVIVAVGRLKERARRNGAVSVTHK